MSLSPKIAIFPGHGNWSRGPRPAHAWACLRIWYEWLSRQASLVFVVSSSAIRICQEVAPKSPFCPQLRKSISLAHADALLRIRLRTWYKWWSRHKSILSLRRIVCRVSYLPSGNTEIVIFSHHLLPRVSINDDRMKQTLNCQPRSVFSEQCFRFFFFEWERWDWDRLPSPARCWCGI